MLQLVAVDMDGTFLRSDQDYDRARFAKVHQMLTDHGVRFVVASGNQYYQLKSFFEAYPETIYVAENGAYIRDETQTYAVHTFTPAETAKITAILTSRRVWGEKRVCPRQRRRGLYHQHQALLSPAGGAANP